MPYVILTVSAALSAGIWLLGVGVPETEHQAMGWLFVALHVTALLIALNPPKKNPNIPVLACLSIVPLEIASIFFLGAVQQAYLKYRPNSDEFIQLCSAAGSRFSSKPPKLVESIAYDWGEKSYAPSYSHFSIDHKGRVSGMASGSRYEQFPNSIKFKESRCCRNTGLPTNRIGPYIRHFGNEYFGVTELTADALVTFKTSKISQAGRDSVLNQVDIEVSDRRTNAILATHRYFLDHVARRGCGETSPGTMDETFFVKKAIGVE